MSGSSEPTTSPIPSAWAALIVTALRASAGRQPEAEAGHGHGQRQARGRRRPRVEVGAERDGNPALDERPGRGSRRLHEEPGRRGQEDRDDRPSVLGGCREGIDPGRRRRREVVGRQRSELDRELRTTGWRELVGVEPGSHPERLGREQDPPALVGREHAPLAEDVGEAGPALGRDPGQLVVEEVPRVGLGRVAPVAELGRDGVGAEPGREDVDRALLAELVGDLEEPQLGPQVEPIAGLRLDGRDPVAEHLIEPAPAVGEEVVGRGRPGRGDGRQDAAAGGQDLEVAGTALPELELALAAAREEQVGMRVDEPGRHHATVGVDPGESRDRQSRGLQGGRDLVVRTDRGDPVAPRRHDGSRGRVGSADRRRLEGRGLGLGTAAPDPAGHRDDGARPVDEQAGRRRLGPPALDDPEAHGRAAWAAASRSSSAWSGEKSRSRMNDAAAASRSSTGADVGAPAWSATSSRAASGASPMSSDSAGCDALRAGPGLDRLPDPPDRRHLEVEQVHRDLGAVGLFEPEAARLDARQAAARLTDGPGDPPGELEVGRGEVDVPGDQERPRPDGHRPGGRVEAGRPEVGAPVGVGRDRLPEPLVLAAPDVGQLLAVRTRRRPGVQVDRDPEPLGHPGAEVPGQPDAVVDRRLAERHERHDVDRPDPRVLPGLALHVDRLDGHGDGRLERAADRLRVAGQGQHAPVVAGVARPVQEVDAGRARDGRGEPVDDLHPPTLAEVRDRFDQPPHRPIVTGTGTRRRTSATVRGGSHRGVP